MSNTRREQLEVLVEDLGAVARSANEPLAEALTRSARRAVGVAILLGIGLIALVLTWQQGSLLGGGGASEDRVMSLATLLAAAWCGYRIAEWRLLRRLARLLDEPDTSA